MAKGPDRGVPLREIFTHREINWLGFHRFLRRGLNLAERVIPKNFELPKLPPRRGGDFGGPSGI